MLHPGTEVWSSCVRFVIGLPVEGSDLGEREYGNGDWVWMGVWVVRRLSKAGEREYENGKDDHERSALCYEL